MWLHRLVTVPVTKLVNLLYGRLLPLHEVLSQAAAGQDLPQGAAMSARSPSVQPISCFLGHFSASDVQKLLLFWLSLS